MKKIYCLLLPTLLLVLSTLQGYSQAKVQFIHSSSDVTLDSIDVYINKSKALDDFKYGYASEFMTGPSGVPLIIDICDATSTSPEFPLYSYTTVLLSGSKYLAITNGMLDPSGYEPFQPFSINISGIGKEIANVSTNTDVLFYHGSTDAPVIDIKETGVGLGQLANNLTYNNFDGYNEMATADYAIEIRDSSDTQMLFNYQLKLQSLGLVGKAVVVVTSGFINPAANNSGKEFRMMMALPAGGQMIILPVVPTPMASFQVVHNAADLNLQNIDVWINDKKFTENFKFRNATPFTDQPAEIETSIKILPANSTSPDNPIFTYVITLSDTKSYILVLNGIAAQSGYTPLTPINVYSFDLAQSTAGQPVNTAILFFHGSTDAPVIDITETGTGLGSLSDNLAYGNFDGYKEITTLDYIFDVKDQTGSTLGRYSAAFGTDNLYGKAISVYASGFVNPASNSNGPAFGLFYTTAEGGAFLPMPAYTEPVTAEIQFIHNSADAMLSTVDIWVNNGLIDDNITYKRASVYHTIPAGAEITVSVLPENSSSHSNPIVSKTLTPESGKKYVVFLDGIASTTGYDPLKPVTLSVFADGRINAATPGKIDCIFHNGATDATAMSVYDIGSGLVCNIMDFAATNGYYELNEANYFFNLMNTSASIFKSYAAPLADLGFTNKAATIVVSGFLNPSVNSNGEAFGMYAIAGTGGAFIPFADITGTNDLNRNGSVSIYPNPASNQTRIVFKSFDKSDVYYAVYDLTGNKVIEQKVDNRSFVNDEITINTSELNEGIYFVKISTVNQEVTRKLSIVR